MIAKRHCMRGCGWSVLLASVVSATPPGFVKTTIPLDAPPAGLAFDAGGTLLALEGAPFGENEATLRVIQPNGAFGPSFPVIGDDLDNFFVGGIAYDPIGLRVFITDNTADGRLYAVDQAGVQQTVGMNLAGIAGVAVRGTGEIFVSTAPFGGPGEVLQVDRTTGVGTPVLGGLGFGAGLAFDAAGNLLVQDADATTFLGRLQRLPMTESMGLLTIGSPETLLAGMQSSAGVVVASDNEILTTGSGGLFRVTGMPLAETTFDTNGDMFQFATAIAFDPGSLPFEGFSGASGGRLAYMADFGFNSQDQFITLLTPAEPGDYNGDGHVDADDYVAWRGAFGSSDPAADGNRDGTVDAADYAIWRKNLPLPQGAALGASVPEPGSAAFLVSLLTSTIGLRRRRHPLQRAAA